MQKLIQWPPTYRQGYLWLMLALLVSLPLSKYVASASQILLLVLWLAERRFKIKWQRFRQRPAIWVFLLVFLWHLVGLFYTADWSYALHDLKIKLPLLILPVVLGTIDPVTSQEKRILLGGFVVAVLISVLAGLIVVTGIIPYEMSNFREISLFISHIRFALLIDMAIFILFFYAFESHTHKWARIVFLVLAAGMGGFLLLLKSLTGLVVLGLGGLILAIRWTLKQKDLMVRWFLMVGIILAPLLVLLYLSVQVNSFYTIHDDLTQLDRETVQGNPYWHNRENTHLENGHFVGLYICEEEMERVWDRISQYRYEGLDAKGQPIKYTLRRYLTSLGLRKDSVGVSRLSPEDIRMVEEGYANCRYKDKNRFSNRVYQLIWEIDVYRKGGNPSGHSVTQRLEYLKTGWAIFMDHPLLGVGTGDVQLAFDQKYEETQSQLEPEWRLRAHNQFLTFLVTFGIIGFVVIMIGLILPPLLETRKNAFFFLMFILVGLLSMLNEDTLETQAGVAFFAFFYAFFTFLDDGKG